ncbi:alpha/beta fold hydrolase [Dyella sp. RRB7]|uniref:alpha/beta hydrolase family protein n=1 Tax=Dyella sp. RRB7 TaxID=2919502 RepID=UPI0031B815D5
MPCTNTSSLPAVVALPAISADGATAEVLLQLPAGEIEHVIYWLPALGVSARQYLPLAQALAEQGVAVAIHEWRGLGSSNRRAGRRDDWGYRQLLVDDLPAGMAALRKRLPQAARCWLGGHSLGSQLAPLYASLHPREVRGLLVIAGGAPYWRCFPQGGAFWLAFALAPWLARVVGHLPGRRIGFGGNEARGLIADWARSGRTGRYAAAGMQEDFEQRLGQLALPLLALRMHDDWLVPAPSLAWLLGKMPHNRVTQQVVTSADLDGTPADHFSWMKTPAPLASRVARWLASVSMAGSSADA